MEETKSDMANQETVPESERPTRDHVIDAEDKENSSVYESTLSESMSNDDFIASQLTSKVVQNTETEELINLDDTAVKSKISVNVYRTTAYSDEIVADPDETVELVSPHVDTMNYAESTSTDDTPMAPITEVNCGVAGCRNFRTGSVIFLIIILILTVVGRFAVKGILETANVDKDSLVDIGSGVDNVFAIICTPIAGILVCFLVNYITCRCRKRRSEDRLPIPAAL